jgi:DNA-binding MarR family transcriptional regulator
LSILSIPVAEVASNDPVDRYLIGALLIVPAQAIRRRVSAALAGDFPDYRSNYDAVFQWLGPEGDRISDLAARCGVSKQAMGETIDWLEQHGYVERVPDPSDGRATLVRRTELGWRVNRIAREQVEATQAEWARALGQAEFAELLRQLRRLVRLLNQPAGVAGHPRTLQSPMRSSGTGRSRRGGVRKRKPKEAQA